MPLLDTHCHIDLYHDYMSLVEEADRERTVVIAVTNTPSVFVKCQEIVEGKRLIRAALGLHPELAVTRQGEVDLFKGLLGRTRFVGEVGLDFVTQDEAERTVQRQVFGTILQECAGRGNKVLTVHSRRAADDVIDMVGPGFPGSVILHWFSGSKKSLERALSYGMYFSVNPAMVRSEAGRKIVDALPLDRLLTETDGPFIQRGNTPIRPSDVQEVLSYIAQKRNANEHQLADTIYTTFRSMVRSSAE